MKKIIYSFSICLLAGSVHAQFLNTADLFVSEDAVMSFNTDVVNEGKIMNNGKIHFQKNLDNQNALQSTGITVFDGSRVQRIKSQSELSFTKILLDNDVRLETPMRVSESMSFRYGVVESSASNPLVFSADARYNGASDRSHVKGVITKEGDQVFEFPLGDGISLRSLKVNGAENQALSASYTYRSPLNISRQFSQNVENISESEYWTLKSESAKGSAKVSINGESGLEEVAYLKRGTWDVLEDSKLSAETDLKNGTLFTSAKSRNIKVEIGVYPNPTEGEYFLKLAGMSESEAIIVDVTNQDGSTIMHKEGLVKDMRRAYQLPENLPATELTIRVQRNGNKPLTQKMILKR